MPEHAPASHAEEGMRALATAAPGVPVADQLAFFARSALTGRDKVIAPASGDGPPRDWGSFLFTWDPPVLAVGSSAGRTPGAGGVFGRALETAASVSVEGAQALYEIRADGAAASMRALDASGAPVAAPADGERVWVVAVNLTSGAVQGTITANPALASTDG